MTTRHAPDRMRRGRIIAAIAETPRHGWTLSEIEEGDKVHFELRRCWRSPAGALKPTGHRSLLRPGTLRELLRVADEREGRP